MPIEVISLFLLDVLSPYELKAHFDSANAQSQTQSQTQTSSQEQVCFFIFADGT